jgi:hypothetical protein
MNKILELMKSYDDKKLDEFSMLLYDDYMNLNFECNDLFDYKNVDLQYKNGCDCNCYCDCGCDCKNYDVCPCGNDIFYLDDQFMHDKLIQEPKI